MPYLDNDAMEKIAARVLHAYWKLPLAQETPWYVDPDLLLSELLGLSIQFRHLSNDSLTLGLTSYSPIGLELPDCEPGEVLYLDGKTVLIEKDLEKPDSVVGRRNFTVMHEGCHHILNMLYPGAYSGGEKDRRLIKYRLGKPRLSIGSEEWQADALTSCLLMPADLLRRNMRLVGLPEYLDFLNPVWRKQSYEQFVSLSELMGVSKQALSYRMKKLKLLGEDQRDNPNRLIDVWRY